MAVVPVQRDEILVGVADENQPTGGAQHATEAYADAEPMLPPYFAGRIVDRRYAGAGLQQVVQSAETDGLGAGVGQVVDAGHVVGRNIEQPALRIEGWGR